MSIRRATPEDADAIARVHIDSWRSAYRGLVPDSRLDSLDYERRAERFRETLGTSSDETYIWEEDREIVGFLMIGPCRDDDIDQKTTGEIWGIYLAPEYWREGIGRKLCRYGERLLRQRGYIAATLWVLADNDNARRFYEKMGFAADGTSKTLEIGIPLEAVRYRKSLEDAGQLDQNDDKLLGDL